MPFKRGSSKFLFLKKLFEDLDMSTIESNYLSKPFLICSQRVCQVALWNQLNLLSDFGLQILQISGFLTINLGLEMTPKIKIAWGQIWRPRRRRPRNGAIAADPFFRKLLLEKIANQTGPMRQCAILHEETCTWLCIVVVITTRKKFPSFSRYCSLFTVVSKKKGLMICPLLTAARRQPSGS